ncbi:DUF3365 domain-containing protein [filamentous cyanobacterium LEGE 11480]|uniref:DUF3365 domain-containing protein n=1 Tax=Romeriopsis navalis LEGE 11480 TaxID=2777977 RepID=A0A928VL79_9CYAN|nr:DUF3365 domain-containing protein [Romeriopsis navalis]MBE9029783.1 DUF3365 domain-containing protein [Romeriopsis navalis LEGE 11480]
MSAIYQWWRSLRLKFVSTLALALAICFTVVACGGGASTSSSGGGGGTTVAGISPEVVVDYIHKVAESDRTAYTKHVIGRLTKLEGKDNKKGVVTAEATEFWKQEKGVPLPAQMFRMGAELASEDGNFTIGLISPWNINDNQAPKDDFEKAGMAKVVETAEPYKAAREIAGKKYYSAIYPDIAVADACVSCHNDHPVHKERHADKVFKKGDVMGGVVINLPLKGA